MHIYRESWENIVYGISLEKRMVMNQVINSEAVKKLFSESGDIKLRPIKINQNNIKTYIFAVDGLINSQLVDVAILQSFIMILI